MKQRASGNKHISPAGDTSLPVALATGEFSTITQAQRATQLSKSKNVF